MVRWMGRWRTLALCLLVTGCARQSDVGEDAGGEKPLDYVVIPSDRIASEAESGLFDAAPPHRTIFVNRHGGTYSSGAENSSQNRSSIVSGTRTVSAYEGSAAEWASFFSCIQDQFARWNVTVTDQDPGAVPHIEAVIGGWPQQIGMGSGVGGVAPMHEDCSIVERAIVYVFTQVLGSPQVECEVAAQEIGHALGMDHEYLCKDPMTYLSGCGAKTFQDQTVSCGEWSPRACMCSAKQNSVQFMNARLGVAGGSTPTPTPSPTPTPTDGAPPEVVALAPAHGAAMAGNTTVSVSARITDDGGIASAVLWWWRAGQWKPFDCDAPPSHVACSVSGDVYTWSLPVGTGTRWWLVRAKDAAGQQRDSEMRSVSFH